MAPRTLKTPVVEIPVVETPVAEKEHYWHDHLNHNVGFEMVVGFLILLFGIFVGAVSFGDNHARFHDGFRGQGLNHYQTWGGYATPDQGYSNGATTGGFAGSLGGSYTLSQQTDPNGTIQVAPDNSLNSDGTIQMAPAPIGK